MNIIKKIAIVNKKIENLNESYWLLIAFIICLVCIVLISPQIIWQPYIHAEDGPIFLKETMNGGISSLFNTFGGYLGLLPRLFALVALAIGKRYNSYIAVTVVMKTCATIFSVLAVNYFNSKEFKNIVNNRILRLLICILLTMVIANHGNMIYTSIMTHWWGDLLILFVGLIFLKKKMPPLYIIPLVILIILSSPVALLISLPLSYYIVCKIISYKKDKNNKKKISIKGKIKIIAILLIIMACVVEIFGMLVLSKNGNVEVAPKAKLSIKYVSNTINRTFKTTARCIPYIISRQLPSEIQNLLTTKVQIIIGTIILIIMTWRYYKNKNIKIFIWGLIMLTGIYFMVYFKNAKQNNLPSDFLYNAIPSAIGIFLVVKWLYDDITKICKEKKELSKVIICLILLIANISFYKNTIKPVYTYCPNMYEVEKRVDFSSSQIEKVGISDRDFWKADVPVRAETP